MAYIFLDESGDLGFNFEKEGTSRKFVVAILTIDKIETINKLLRHIRKNILRKKDRKMIELSFYKTEKKLRIKILKQINKIDFSFIYLVVDKTKIDNNLQNNPDKLYNYAAGILKT